MVSAAAPSRVPIIKAMDDKAKDEYNRMLGPGRAVNLENVALQNDHSFEQKAFLITAARPFP